MNKNHTNEPNYTKLVMPRQLVLPLDYGILIKETAPLYIAIINIMLLLLYRILQGFQLQLLLVSDNLEEC